MARIKVVNEASDLVGLMTAVDSPVKRDVFLALSAGWESERTIESRFGLMGRAALNLLDKQDMLDSRWEPTAEGPNKMFHARYSSFKIDTTAPMAELSEVFAVAVMPGPEFKEKEEALTQMALGSGVNVMDAAVRLALSQTMVRAIAKRSQRLDLRGLRVVTNGVPDRQVKAAASGLVGP
ncbi:MAG TPA: ArsR family transcriptional regulator [Candidatus Thermoplasmatota archaeon]